MTGAGMAVSRKLVLILLLPALIALAGCGYRLTANPDYVSPVSGKKIAVPVFANKSYRANLGAFMTESIVDEFSRRSGGKLVGEDGADLVLTGVVNSYASTPVSYSAADKVRAYQAVMTVEATLTEKKTLKVLWKGTIPWSQVYPVNSVVALQQNSEEAAIREICAKLAQQIYERVSAGF